MQICFSSLIALLAKHLYFELNLLKLIGKELTIIRFQTIVVALFLMFAGLVQFIELIMAVKLI